MFSPPSTFWRLGQYDLPPFDYRLFWQHTAYICAYRRSGFAVQPFKCCLRGCRYDLYIRYAVSNFYRLRVYRLCKVAPAGAPYVAAARQIVDVVAQIHCKRCVIFAAVYRLNAHAILYRPQTAYHIPRKRLHDNMVMQPRGAVFGRIPVCVYHDEARISSMLSLERLPQLAEELFPGHRQRVIVCR